MKKYVYFGILALLGARAGVSALHPLSARAAEPPQIFVSEINWGGSKTSTADEWLEIANTSNTDVDLSNWYFTGIGTSGGVITLPQGSMIKAESTFLVANYNLSDAKTTLNVLPDYVTTAVSIPNSSLNVHLFMPDGTETDSYVDTSTPDYGSTSPMTSIERNLADLSWKSSVSNSGLLDQTQLGTPGSAVFPVVEVAPEETPPTTSIDPVLTPTPSLEEETTPDTASTESTLLTPTLSEGEGATPDPVPTAESVETPAPSADVTSETTIEEPILETIVQTVDPIPTETVEPSMTDIVIEETDVPVEPSPVIEAEVTDTPNAVGTVEVTPVADVVDAVIETVVPEATTTSTTAETPSSSPVTVGETAVEPSPVVIPSFAAGTLTINELLPSPDDADEWVELFNPGSTDIALTGWTLQDASGKITKLEETSLKSHSFLVVTNPSGKLNNSGDTITLIDPSNNVIDSVIYGTTEIPAPKKGVALARDVNGTWGTTAPTPGATNVFPVPTPTVSTSSSSSETEGETATTTTPITNTSTSSYVTQSNNTETTVGALGTAQSAVAKADHVSSKPAKTTVRVESTAKAKTPVKKSGLVTLEGTIIVPPNVFGKQIAFLNGLELYFNKANWPNLSVGSHIKVTGTMSESNGNKRLKIAKAEDIVVLGMTSPLPSPLQGEGETIGNLPHGTLIAFSGTVADKKGSTLTVILASGEAVPVVIPKGVPLSAKLLTAGSIVDVTGVLKRKDGAWTVALRSADDIVLSVTSRLSSPASTPGKAIAASSSNMPIVGGGLLTSTLGALGYWYAKSKGLSLLTLIRT